MDFGRSSNRQLLFPGGRNLTRREFLPRMTAAMLGAGALLQAAAAGAAPARSAGDMKYRELGQTGILVPEIGFGAHVSDQNMQDSRTRAAQIREGLERGINLFDIYEHQYHQFEPMSKVLGPVRQDVLISLVTVYPSNHVKAEIEYALKAFNTDAIDLYRVYVAEDAGGDDMKTRWEALLQAKKQGKIRAIGVAAHDQTVMVEALQNLPGVDYILFPYNFRHQKFSPLAVPGSVALEPAEGGSADERPNCSYIPCPDPRFGSLVKEKGVGMIAMKAFGSGRLLKLRMSRRVLAELMDPGVSLPQAALKFVLSTPEIASVIPAMNSVDEVRENVGAAGQMGLSEPEKQYLQLYNEAAELCKGSYLPEHYRWLERYA